MVVGAWSLVILRLPVPAAAVIKHGFVATDRIVDFSVAKNFAAHHPGADGPTGERNAVPGGPAALGLLLAIADCRQLLHIDKDQIGIVADGDAAFVDDV